jgi:hypothetical protein
VSMATSNEPWQPLLDRLVQLQSAWPGSAWGWDARFKCVSSSFSKEIAARARAAMADVLTHEWSSDSIGTAPDEVRTLSARYGGVRASQFLFTADPVAGMLLYGLWWPWGDDATISLRVGVANSDRPTELFPQVRAVFNIV